MKIRITDSQETDKIQLGSQKEPQVPGTSKMKMAKMVGEVGWSRYNGRVLRQNSNLEDKY